MAGEERSHLRKAVHLSSEMRNWDGDKRIGEEMWESEKADISYRWHIA